MDSYNRGYKASINISGNNIGNASILIDSFVLKKSDGSRVDEPVGFYAVAYSYGSGTIISYREADALCGDEGALG